VRPEDEGISVAKNKAKGSKKPEKGVDDLFDSPDIASFDDEVDAESDSTGQDDTDVTEEVEEVEEVETTGEAPEKPKASKRPKRAAEAEEAEVAVDEDEAPATKRPKKKAVDKESVTEGWEVYDKEAKTGSKKSDSKALEGKGHATRTRAEATKEDAPKRTGPIKFVGQIVQELKKVSWPSSGQLTRFFLVVLVFVVFMIAFISLLDLFFGWAMLSLFG
jgi:preprotein translocase subunit SecE